MSTTRKMPGGRADRETLPKGENGRVLCRWCAMEVPPPRRTFCSEWCVTEWRLRSDPGYLREKVFLRDRGICAVCAVDTVHALHVIKRARGVRRLELLARWGLKKMTRRSLWDADHIVPVVEGGGECDLENIRTLCLICHRRETRQLRERLVQARKSMATDLLSI
jgi:5-methylcytosine-specific restriction endonuclease McrA